MRLKKDKEQFEEIVDGLCDGRIKGLPSSRRWVAKYIYHFSDVENIVSILQFGHIFSRKYVESGECVVKDIASKTVIDQTQDKWKGYTRFYFRPKTPTQYRNEGIRSKSTMTLDAHCPVPIFLLFDSKKMLCREDALFSYGSLARDTDQVYSTAEEYSNMPFPYVFHEGSYNPLIDSDIKYHRHAELIIPNKFELDCLEKIVCRSVADKETLINLLNEKNIFHYNEDIVVDTRRRLFYGHWTYVEKATLTKENITITFHTGDGNPSFEAYLEICEHSTGKKYVWKEKEFTLENNEFSLKNLKAPQEYAVKFYLDNNLVYFGQYIDDEVLPF